jgi:hypothetical protein
MQHLFLGWAKCWRFHLLLILHVYSLSYLQAALSVTETAESITIHLGSGANVSHLAFVESSLNPKSIIYAWHYDGLTNPDASLRTGIDLFNAVQMETDGSPWALSYSTDDYGLTTSFTVGSATSRVVDPLKSPVWTYWIQGGSEYVEFGDSESFTFLVGNSLIISPAYWDTRYLTNGSYDVWTITPFSSTGAPSDTHEYTDISGKAQTVTFGTYEGSAPVLTGPPKLLSSRILSGGQLEIVFSVLQGGVYQLQAQEGLTQNSWQNFEPPFIATTTEKTYTLPMNNPSKRAFFRLVRRE